MEKLILKNRLSPGDILIMTVALRDLHKTFPGEYQTDVRSPCGEIFNNNPYLIHLNKSESKTIDMQYPLIHRSGTTGRHFTDGYREFLSSQIGRTIEAHGMRPEIYLSQDELLWPNPVTLEYGLKDPYWIINAGVKDDYTLKQYPYWQEVVDLLKDEITFVQVGHEAHSHPPLDGVLDMRGKTTLRQLFRLSYHAEGALCAVSLQMVIMAAFEKPCVVINGGREGIRWQLNPNHRFLATHGALPCCRYDGCWKSKFEQCETLEHDGERLVPKCMQLITPEAVAQAARLYYQGGILQREAVNV